jgi:hypothetical protein
MPAILVDQEDHSSKPALGKQFMRPGLGGEKKKPNTKKEQVEWLEV